MESVFVIITKLIASKKYFCKMVFCNNFGRDGMPKTGLNKIAIVTMRICESDSGLVLISLGFRVCGNLTFKIHFGGLPIVYGEVPFGKLVFQPKAVRTVGPKFVISAVWHYKNKPS